MTLDEALDELYGVDPGDFVELRKKLTAQAKKAGDRELANDISRLRKPTQVAWLVNVLAREHADEVAGLLDLGDALRDAQRHLSGPELRKLNSERQKVVRTLAATAGDAAADRGQRVGEGALREVGQSLHAALADPDVAEQVRAGRLVTAVSYSGFGPAGLSVVGTKEPARTAESREKSRTTQRSDDTLRSAEADLEAADAAATSAEEKHEAARNEADAAADRVRELDARLEELRAETERVEQERKFAKSAEHSDAQQASKAERGLDRARQALRKAGEAVEKLRQ